MCNPPFYSSNSEKYELCNNKKNKRIKLTTSTDNESVTNGGEKQFLLDMVKESALYADRVVYNYGWSQRDIIISKKFTCRAQDSWSRRVRRKQKYLQTAAETQEISSDEPSFTKTENVDDNNEIKWDSASEKTNNQSSNDLKLDFVCGLESLDSGCGKSLNQIKKRLWFCAEPQSNKKADFTEASKLLESLAVYTSSTLTSKK
ncbi:hypothetical protein BB561_002046 [Smittium simulii]|uniref:Uncharacterized protein n=1 Tax=Smittium simulii TaxID=133385 RepID=A0A2T9YRT3_9FUNG|nr:hypothetical protein BB561_002046 [Smittium simulii]